MSIEIAYYPVQPADTPGSGYPGFHPHTELYPKGYQAQEGRLPFACDTICEQDVEIVLRDGTKIYADVYRPVTDTPVPAILAWGPAGKRGRNLATGLPMPPMGNMPGMPKGKKMPPPPKGGGGMPKNSELSGLQAHGGQDPAVWVQYGYAIVNADPRGIFASEGDIQYFGTTDAQDGYDTIEWIAAQPWCSGKVAMSGDHWYAIEQWFIAAQQPPHLCAIAPAEGHGNFYVDETVRGGIPRLDPSARSRSYSTHGAKIEDICEMAKRYPLYNEYWADKTADFSKISIPAYVTASWTQTYHSRGTFEGFRQIASKDKWLRVHDIGEFIDFRKPENILDLKKFFDHFLKDVDNGWEKTPRVRLATLDPGGENLTNRPRESFPQTNQTICRAYLRADGTMQPQPVPQADQVAYQADDSQSVATFTMAFSRETEITGFLKLKLWVEADGSEDADLFIRLFKLDAQGEKLYATKGNRYSGPNGRLRASHRAMDPDRSTELEPVHPHTFEQLLHPGEIVPVEIGIWPTSLRFHPGQQLMVQVAGFEVAVDHGGDALIETRNHGRHILHMGGTYDSCLYYPVVPIDAP